MEDAVAAILIIILISSLWYQGKTAVLISANQHALEIAQRNVRNGVFNTRFPDIFGYRSHRIADRYFANSTYSLYKKLLFYFTTIFNLNKIYNLKLCAKVNAIAKTCMDARGQQGVRARVSHRTSLLTREKLTRSVAVTALLIISNKLIDDKSL